MGEIIVGDDVVGPPCPLSAPAIYRFDPNEAEAFTVCRTPTTSPREIICKIAA